MHNMMCAEYQILERHTCGFHYRSPNVLTDTSSKYV